MAATRRRSGLRRPRRDSSPGQVLVLFALGITVLFAAAGMAFDVGRFYSERRFLQNAADAAALAAANALIRGETSTQADARAREVLAQNFTHSPSGTAPAQPPTSPVYEVGHAGDPDYLANGILINGSEVRVAVQNPVGYTFGRLIGLDQNTIGGRARTAGMGNVLPIAVRRYVNLPGPNAGAASPCPDNQSQFMDFFATADTSCLGIGDEHRGPDRAVAPAARSTAPTPTTTRRTTGRSSAILGQGAQPSNGADFRGFIALDIRNFAATGTQLYYNNVTPSTNANTLKAMEANWVTVGGYPGPAVPGRDHAAGPERPGRDDVRQLDRHRDRRGPRALRARRRGPHRGLPGQRHVDPGLHDLAAGHDLPCRRPGRPPAPAR